MADLDTAVRLDLSPGYAIEIQSLAPEFEPQLLVLERDTGTWNKDESARIGKAIKSGNPASALRTP